MRKIVLLLLLAFVVVKMPAKLRVEVSETVELTSILATLAGYDEYNEDYGTQYKQDIEEWFAPYKNHATVDYFSQIRSRNYIMYDAVASMGIHLYVEDQKIKMQDNITLMDSRSQSVNRSELLEKLNSFYKDCRFHEFFQNHQSLYDTYLNSFNQHIVPQINEDWYPQFYGTQSKDNYVVVLAFNNGYNGYGPRRKVSDDVIEAFSVLGVYDNMDFSRNSWDYATTIIHEFNHSYVNNLLENSSENQNMMRDSGEWLYQLTAWSMNNQSYTNWQTVINETIVRAAEVIYLIDNKYSAELIDEKVRYQISRSFLWTPEIVEQLRYYSQHRNEYNTLGEFYPRLAQCLSSYVEKEKKRLENCIGLPKVETYNVAADNVSLKFQTNRDTPTTVTLVGATLTSQTAVNIPSTVNGYQVKAIGKNVFRENRLLTKVTIPEGVETISDDAFSWSSLEEITLPSTLKSLGYCCMAVCNQLRELKIPASVTKLDFQCIANNRITSLEVVKDNPIYDSRDNCNAIIETATNTLVHATLATVIPKSVTALGVEAYNTLQQMEEVTIPSWITSIGDRAFQYCTGLQSIYCYIEKPYPISTQAFTWVTDQATLYVPFGTKSLYQHTNGWKEFKNIVEMEPTAISNVTYRGATEDVYYDLNGTRVEKPGKGVFIKNGKKEVYNHF